MWRALLQRAASEVMGGIAQASRVQNTNLGMVHQAMGPLESTVVSA